MSTRMLIDARHPEETRVTVVKGNRVEEFDYETSSKLRLKGNIYLAKVTRVEPSLQAAFIDYGGNRHGFLAFSEIHPDYYLIPRADREAILAEEAKFLETENGEAEPEQAAEEAGDDNAGEGEVPAETAEARSADEAADEEYQESLRRRRLRRLKRRYKIQEVIKRRQILLVQVVKEERGNKGAALTTYLSIPGRYCVLMPNTTHSGGISRKISNVKDRRRLRDIMDELKVPDGMGCIIRTAGTERTKAEIKRDFDYLMRLWDGIRETTLKSVAPTLIYEEGDLIKRSIRDLYDRSIDEVLVEGEEGYKSAKEFMKLLIPSHTKRVQNYKDRIPLFHRYQVESQLEDMFHPVVRLKSGGYIVLNPTEALIAIDVNSGRSTREHNIEETALKTNIEAAVEIAKQLRLRDLAGLIVIDFIDMEYRNNVRQVERKMREAVKGDRARIQLGKISNFGLMEISRQRLRPNLVETATEQCIHCEGTGRVRSVASSALHVLRAIEEECIRERGRQIKVLVPRDVAVFLLNQKRQTLSEFETNYDVMIAIDVDDSLVSPAHSLELVEAPEGDGAQTQAEPAKAVGAAKPAATAQEDEEPRKKPRRRRRGGRRRGRGGRPQSDKAPEAAKSDEGKPGTEPAPVAADGSDAGKAPEKDAGKDQAEPAKQAAKAAKKPSRSRGRGKKETKKAADTSTDTAAESKEPSEMAKDQDKAAKPAKKPAARKTKKQPARKATSRAAKSSAPKDQGEPKAASAKSGSSAGSRGKTAKKDQKAAATADKADAKKAKPAAASSGNGKNAPEKKDAQKDAASDEAGPADTKEPSGPKKKGWWSKSLRQ